MMIDLVNLLEPISTQHQWTVRFMLEYESG